jgi:hypothetical protein
VHSYHKMEYSNKNLLLIMNAAIAASCGRNMKILDYSVMASFYRLRVF